MVVKRARKIVRKTKNTTVKFSHEFQKQATIALIAAFGFIIALVWRDFVQNNSNQLLAIFGLEKGTFFNDFMIAIIITAIAIIGITLISALKPSEKEKEMEKGKQS